SGFVLAKSFHTQPYYPSIELFPNVNPSEYTLSGTLVANQVDRTNLTTIKSYKKPFGYADNQLRGTAPYTLPDNPYTPERENAGGDAFDISWAVDENGEYVDLDVIHFVKVHTGVMGDGGWLGEISTEITGAVAVTPNPSITGELDLIVIKALPNEIEGNSFQMEAFAYHKGRWEKDRVINWTSNLAGASVNSSNLLTFTSSGEVTLTASLADRPDITATVSTTLIYNDIPSSIDQNKRLEVDVYPNPATDNVFIKGVANATVEIYSSAGTYLFSIIGYSSSLPIWVGHLSSGVYVIKINGSDVNKTVRFIKK
ncbi:MAG TPA: T9SS type A sorting domain-containing protein, partial [Marinilabiliaceae bacterium]|nr:T9SS type A sorting domain-containing protein [Marinilabiliaceae bacterium]